MTGIAHKKRRQLPIIAGLVGIAIVSFAGSKLMDRSFAIDANQPNNPFGYADYCQLENNRTVIYGWQHDTNAPAGPLPNVIVRVNGVNASVPTDQVGYRQAGIDESIKYYFPNMPLSNTYGFKASFDGLYKGGIYKISGTAINVGAGQDVPLEINTFTDFSGNNAPKREYFANYNIPEGCLAVRPVATPAPTAAPTPAPTTTTPRPVTTTRTVATPAPVPQLADDAGSVADVGSLTAIIQVPAGNATKLHIIYGVSGQPLDTTTPDQNTDNQDSTITLTSLLPSTLYAYQVVRMNDSGSTTTSGFGSFTTDGFSIVMHFVDSKNAGIKGITASLNGTKLSGISDENGLLRFGSVPAGDYTVSYAYAGKTQKLPITARPTAVSSNDATKPAEAPLDFFVNVDTKTIAVKTKTAAAPAAPYWLFGLIGLGALCLIAIIIVLRRRRKQQADDGGAALAEQNNHAVPPSPVIPIDDTAAAEAALVLAVSPTGTPASDGAAPHATVHINPEKLSGINRPPFVGMVVPEPVKQPVAVTTPKPKPLASPPIKQPVAPVAADDPKINEPAVLGPLLPDDNPEHMGESLKSMVMRSMAEEARRRGEQDSQDTSDKTGR